jgi:hypothetical protein
LSSGADIAAFSAVSREAVSTPAHLDAEFPFKHLAHRLRLGAAAVRRTACHQHRQAGLARQPRAVAGRTSEALPTVSLPYSGAVVVTAAAEDDNGLGAAQLPRR